MQIDIAKDDLQMLRTAAYLQYRYLEKASKGERQRPPLMDVLAKFIRKLNRALKKVHGHDCGAACYPVD